MSLAWQQDWERWESDRFKQAFVVECFTKSHWGEEGGGFVTSLLENTLETPNETEDLIFEFELQYRI